MAGSTNDLRVQTQQRIDDGLLGYRTDKNGDTGIVRKCKGKTIQTKTSCDPKGDYKKNLVFSSIAGDDCVLYVVKKNGSVLRNILEDLFNQQRIDNKSLIENTPVLVIDDEADYASPNTNGSVIDPLTLEPINKEDLDPTIINRYIRAILSCFEKSAYIGYTATPYANIFELPNHGKDLFVKDKKLNQEIYIGEDLFPRSFIYKLDSPLNYIGIEKIFGTEDDGSDAIPVIINADDSFPEDFEEIITGAKHKSTKVVLKDNPDSLKYAIKCFIIASIVKDIRKTRVIHNTMLIHICRLTLKQNEIKNWVCGYISQLKDIFTIEEPSTQKKFILSIKEIWDNEFCNKYDDIFIKLGKPTSIYPVPWKEIEIRIPKFISTLTCKIVNGKTLDVLDYENHKNGLNVIAIGGDKLARGLTLEGLTISYFIRNAGTYDTLTQMGRWFGYRDGYFDVCRIFTMRQTYNNFREIAIAVHDMYQQFDDLYRQGNHTPMDYGLRILTNPKSKLLITAKNKSRGAIKHTISFSGSPVPTAYLPTDSQINKTNMVIFRNFIQSLSIPTGCASSVREKGKSQYYYWRNVPTSLLISKFLKTSFTIDKQNSWFTLSEIASFVESINAKHDGIKYWTVVLANGSVKDIPPIRFGDISVLASERKLEYMTIGQTYYELNRRRISSGSDEAFDLTIDQYNAALQATNNERAKRGKDPTNTPNSHYIRLNRDKSTALLILYPLYLKHANGSAIEGIFPGFMISFPELGYREKDLSFWANIVYAKNTQNLKLLIRENKD